MQRITNAMPELMGMIEQAIDETVAEQNGTPRHKPYTGAIATKDPKRNALAGALRLGGASNGEIAAKCGCDVRVVPMLLAAAEREGLVPSLKERLSIAMASNAEMASIALSRALDRAAEGKESMELAGMLKGLSTAMGVSTDKVLLLTGQATEIIEHRVTLGRSEIESWLAENSIPIQAKVEQISPACGPDTATGGVPGSCGLPQTPQDTSG